MYLTAKKVDYIFEERLIFIYLLVRFFSVPFWIPGGNIEETIYFEQWWWVQYPSTQNTIINFFSAISVMQVIFWTEDNFL